jgi:hypothetical protein
MKFGKHNSSDYPCRDFSMQAAEKLKRQRRGKRSADFADEEEQPRRHDEGVSTYLLPP